MIYYIKYKIKLNKIKMDYKFKFLLFALLINISYEEALEIEVMALSGLVNTNYDSKERLFTFDILCEVNKNITNNIAKINIKIKVKKYPVDNEPLIDAICHLKPVRVAKDSVSQTLLKCFFDTTDYPFIKEDIILIYANNYTPDYGTLDQVTFTFNKFEDISRLIRVNMQTLNNLNDDSCIHNNYLFEINTDFDFGEDSLLESTICRVEISGDEFHKIARCAIPMKGNIMKCYVDVEEKKYKKGDIIAIEKQEVVLCDNGQAIKLLCDQKKMLSVKEECGEEIFTNNNYLYFNKLSFSLLFILVFFN